MADVFWLLATIGMPVLVALVLMLVGMRQLTSIRTLTNEDSLLIRALTRTYAMLGRLRRGAD